MQLARLTLMLTLFGNLSCGPVPDLARAVVTEADNVNAPIQPTPAPTPACVPVADIQGALDAQYERGYAAGRASVSCSCHKNKCTCN